VDQALNRRVGTQTRNGQGPDEVKDVPDIHPPGSGHEAADIPLEPAVVQDDVAGGGIEALAFEHGVFLHHVAEGQRGGEGVAELDDAEGGDDGD